MARWTAFLLVTCLVTCLVAATGGGCAKQRTPAPEAVVALHATLVDSLQTAPPGFTAHRLGVLLRRCERYTLADTVRLEIEQARAAAIGRYREARELVRQGDFVGAEAILEDLAIYLPDTRDGEAAAAHLAYDFPYGKATWLMARQRFAESRAVALELRDRDLLPDQVEQVEAILDQLGHIDAAQSLIEISETRNACRHLSVMIAMRFVDEGAYPLHLTMQDLQSWRALDREPIVRGLSAIEDYRSSEDGFSFVGVSKNGLHRVSVINGQIVED